MSSEDVENYKMIKSSLDDLRLRVEKSELWVYKSKGDEGKDKKDVSARSCDVSCFQVTSLCVILLIFRTKRRREGQRRRRRRRTF